MQNLTEIPIRSEQLVDGKLLKVYRDEVRLPDGTASVREWIDHPGAAAVVPLFEDGTTLLVRQYRYAPRRLTLEVPAGKIDHDDEDPEAVAARELEEETAWRAGRLVPLGAFYPCIGYSNEIIHFYLAEDLSKVEHLEVEGEFLEVVSLDFKAALAMARRGELSDMKTVVALLLAEAHRAGLAPPVKSL